MLRPQLIVAAVLTGGLRKKRGLRTSAMKASQAATMTAFSNSSGGAGRGARRDGIHRFFRAIP
jgi:hypothetical protein